MRGLITIGTDWSSELIDKLSELDNDDLKIHEVYGSLPDDGLGTAREKERLHKCDYSKLEEHVINCHKKNIEVAYANNALCLGSSKDIEEKSRLFLNHLERLSSVDVDRIILASPVFMELVKDWYPDMKISASSVIGIDSVKTAAHFRDIGVDTVILPRHVNRDFRLLESLAKLDEVEPELLMNVGCVLDCPYEQSHLSAQAHDSIAGKGDIKNSYVKNYPYDRCWDLLKKDWPAEFLKCGWIRPEDVKVYEGIGIRKFKISGRTMPPEWTVKTAEAYIKRDFSGNLLELVPLVPGNCDHEGSWPLDIPNKKLDGFLDYFKDHNQDCRIDCGTSCRYCEEYADKIRK